MKMWSGRVREQLDPTFESWQRSLTFDKRLLDYELKASRAHARALKETGIVSSDELSRVLDGLDEISQRARSSPEFLEDPHAEDVHHFVEKRLVELIGEPGQKLHSGRSRNEQIATDLRLYVCGACEQALEGLSQLVRVLLSRAEQAGNSLMPAYTHMQRAEPVLVAHWLLAYVEMLFRDSDRLRDCRQRASRCPLGSGAVAGSALRLNRLGMARELGFLGLTLNSVDATSDRDFALEFVGALSILAMHLSRWAEEMLLFSSEEYGFLRPAEAYSTGSSAMPQKLNADLLELVRGKTGRVMGDSTTLLITMKGLPLAYNKDLQETQEPLFDASDTVLSLLPLVKAWMETVELDFTRMQKAAQTSHINALAAATYLVEKGVAFRHAHERIGAAVRMALARRCQLEELDLESLKQVDPHFADDFYQFVKLENVLALYDVAGGTAPARVKDALRAARSKVAALSQEAYAHS